jgi:hypothetical protein
MPKRKWPYFVGGGVLAVGGLLLVAWLSYPALVRWAIRQKIDQLEKGWQRRATIGTIRAGWGWVELNDVQVSGPHDPENCPLLRADRVRAEFVPSSVLFGRPQIKKVEIIGPRLCLANDRNGRSNFADIAARLKKKRRRRPLGPAVDHVLLENGSIRFKDARRGLVFEAPALAGRLERMRTLTLTLSEVRLERRRGAGAVARRVRFSWDLSRKKDKLWPTVELWGGRLAVHPRLVLTEIDGSLEPLRETHPDSPHPDSPHPDSPHPDSPHSDSPHSDSPHSDSPHSDSPHSGTVQTASASSTQTASASSTQTASASSTQTASASSTQTASPPFPFADAVAGVRLKLSGSYGSARGKLWEANGLLNWSAGRADVEIAARQFTLDKLAGWLKSRFGRAVVNPKQTRLDGGLRLRLEKNILRFNGTVAVSGLQIQDRRIAKKTLRDLDFDGALSGHYDMGAHRLVLSSLKLNRKGATIHLNGTVSRLHTRPRVALAVRVPPTPCRQILAALPANAFPKVKKLRVRGTFSMELAVAVDFDYLTHSSVNLDFDVRHEGCRVIHAPHALAAGRLKQPFVHEAVDGDLITAIELGPQNADFVPLENISRHVINSILTTEDSRFFHHRGFIHREFRSALARNLIAGKFKYGASSISMQLVKNVLLNREKTLSRKLQELILTAYIERHLSKQRIMEIYLNVIEFGPGLYGIGRAAMHYFGKPAALIEPQEAAFLSTLLPSPKKRYIHFCRGQVTKRWRRWIDRILKIMYKRHRLTKSELDAALAAPLIFSRLEFTSGAACRARIRRFRQGGRQPAS